MPLRTNSLRWRHNDQAFVSNHQPHGCLLNRLFRRRSNKTSKLRVTGLCVGNSPGPVNSPHKRPVTRKMFPFDDVIMDYIYGFRTGSFYPMFMFYWQLYLIVCWCFTTYWCFIFMYDKSETTWIKYFYFTYFTLLYLVMLLGYGTPVFPIWTSHSSFVVIIYHVYERLQCAIFFISNIFRVTCSLCGECDWCIPFTKASDAGFWCFLWSAPEQTIA